ncbi:TPA: glycosyl transferase family 1 [candidate division CPR2 bacterium]|uniref:Glycosyltransferase n=1 Tax=candidate division CPR2 bacterium GW2011_GWC1_41_48 TaxID=1618344 RepID=A0A0G0Z8I1_UNCC2|nr:MAG: Glycosyltransferase [candidate division CPR2 bacterium GW2011_GWC2_39_35]KKR28306.1 MAG: Glycosyltransferase [candidate division CPR2 bacterium GW2011_GWD2_39_7]KKR28947.1 MAG: Glycosyltransferase [candidate division CPR2 bacterium GW2011_GWD1_39_7]KKS09358.1 MAG: Glycosyltransferase [candidate division CPR2 bacterium GW2011_GWC1_41_48]OGB61777.1 MAG: hypothetical protein A2Y27_03025 [candidate division CPR2 bacterium GWD1_39_7]OGB72448.1 MAG: hypothetical protein A2Y26_01785 [candidat
MRTVNPPPKSFKRYRKVILPEFYEEILELASSLQDTRIIYVNSTSYGGGVAEILRTQIPLLRDLGIDAVWKVMAADPGFFDVTKAIHNALQGNKDINLLESSKDIYEITNAINARILSASDWDILYIHDPQPLAIPLYLNGKGINALWRCHIETSLENEQIWDYLNPLFKKYRAAVFSMDDYTKVDVKVKKKFVIPPAIDPLSFKNRTMPQLRARRIIRKLGIDVKRPLVTQISRFDPWKDPLGVIKAYRQAKREIPELQLVLVGSQANDDPESFIIFEELVRLSKRDKDIKIFGNLTDSQVNAFQRASDVIIQKSIKEGFGLTVSEALYKETPVIGGNVGGIRKQIIEGEDGYLVGSIKECAIKIVELVSNPDLRLEMGKRGRKIARDRFLLPRLIRDELRVFKYLLAN